jgi:hypothetical protein
MSKMLLEALLGPEDEPLSCEECFDELDAYVERVLRGPEEPFERCRYCRAPATCGLERESVGMRAHLESCPACHEEYESLRDLVLSTRPV